MSAGKLLSKASSSAQQQHHGRSPDTAGGSCNNNSEAVPPVQQRPPRGSPWLHPGSRPMSDSYTPPPYNGSGGGAGGGTLPPPRLVHIGTPSGLRRYTGPSRLEIRAGVFRLWRERGRPLVGESEGRRFAPLGGAPPLRAATTDVKRLFRACNPACVMNPTMPRRVLTNPPKGVGNNGHDNADANLICCVNDELEAPGTRYVVLDLLGQGTFGQVFRCQDTNTRKVVAVKVVKNKPAYRAQADIEIRVARLLNDTFDPDNSRHIVRLLDSFAAHNHLCLVFELLSINIYELLKTNQFRGLPLPMIRSFTKQMLEALAALEAAHVIHCDLKPENVLMVSKLHRGGGSGGGGGSARPAAAIKLIDFGSACWEGNTMYSYIQSRFYRSPEVLLGLPYDGAIDMWSLGCMCLEMFLGLPIFPGVSDHNQISRIVEMVGLPPEFMLQNGRDTLKFFRRERVVTRPPGEGAWGSGLGLAAMDANGDGSSAQTVEHRYVLKTPEEYARDTSTAVPVTKKYFKHSNIPDIIKSYPMPRRRQSTSGANPGAAEREAQREQEEREARRVFTHFCLGLLSMSPWARWTPRQAAAHPFITGEPAPRDLSAVALPVDTALINERLAKHLERLRFKQQQDAAAAAAAAAGGGGSAPAAAAVAQQQQQRQLLAQQQAAHVQLLLRRQQAQAQLLQQQQQAAAAAAAHVQLQAMDVAAPQDAAPRGGAAGVFHHARRSNGGGHPQSFQPTGSSLSDLMSQPIDVPADMLGCTMVAAGPALYYGAAAGGGGSGAYGGGGSDMQSFGGAPYHRHGSSFDDGVDGDAGGHTAPSAYSFSYSHAGTAVPDFGLALQRPGMRGHRQGGGGAAAVMAAHHYHHNAPPGMLPSPARHRMHQQQQQQHYLSSSQQQRMAAMGLGRSSGAPLSGLSGSAGGFPVGSLGGVGALPLSPGSAFSLQQQQQQQQGGGSLGGLASSLSNSGAHLHGYPPPPPQQQHMQQPQQQQQQQQRQMTPQHATLRQQQLQQQQQRSGGHRRRIESPGSSGMSGGVAAAQRGKGGGYGSEASPLRPRLDSGGGGSGSGAPNSSFLADAADWDPFFMEVLADDGGGGSGSGGDADALMSGGGGGGGGARNWPEYSGGGSGAADGFDPEGMHKRSVNGTSKAGRYPTTPGNGGGGRGGVSQLDMGDLAQCMGFGDMSSADIDRGMSVIGDSDGGDGIGVDGSVGGSGGGGGGSLLGQQLQQYHQQQDDQHTPHRAGAGGDAVAKSYTPNSTLMAGAQWPFAGADMMSTSLHGAAGSPWATPSRRRRRRSTNPAAGHMYYAVGSPQAGGGGSGQYGAMAQQQQLLQQQHQNQQLNHNLLQQQAAAVAAAQLYMTAAVQGGRGRGGGGAPAAMLQQQLHAQQQQRLGDSLRSSSAPGYGRGALGDWGGELDVAVGEEAALSMLAQMDNSSQVLAAHLGRVAGGMQQQQQHGHPWSDALLLQSNHHHQQQQLLQQQQHMAAMSNMSSITEGTSSQEGYGPR